MSEITELLDQLQIKYQIGGSHRNVRRGWVGIDCPQCGLNAGKFHLGIEESTGRAVCWKCGRVDIVKLLSDQTNWPLGAIAKRIRAGQWAVGRPDRLSKPTKGLRVPSDLTELRTPHKAYLSRRGLSPDDIEITWGLKATGIVGRLAWRIWIPIHFQDRIVSWTTRAIGNHPIRYIAARPEEEALPAKQLLYGEQHVRHSILVVEGPVDAWRVGPGAVAALGLTVTREQMSRITKYPRRTICFDRKTETQAHRLANSIATEPGETVVYRIESGDDPATINADELREIRQRFLGYRD